ncbi:MAG: pitrilysin family protein [Verrucomicrobiota bacterium]|nr:insulinase family protein [Limisphaera sp.]MDW8381901.1 pitrilysin family protein [Verrucomicrobiota bacterium]
MTAQISIGPARFGGFVWGVLTWLIGSIPAAAQQVPVVEVELTNGMRLLMVERRDEPSVAGGWVAHVGSANERPGMTGLTHLFEHMMFKGTRTIGTLDPARDLEIIAEQERIREQMRQEESKLRAAWRRGEIDDWRKPEHRTPRLRELEAAFQKLVEEQRRLLVKNEFDRIYTAAGASGMNAFTTEDFTAYFITLPANKLELWMWMESERLRQPVLREFYAEREVVSEERRLRIESTPLGRFEEAFNALFWQAHPYHWPVIGWPSDIAAISKAQADEFYATYYIPENVTLVLVGDLQTNRAIALAQKYFGRIPRGNRTPPEVLTEEIPPVAERRMYAEVEANPQVRVAWLTVPFAHRDSYALELLSELLSHRTGRLYKGLVLGRQIATQVSATQNSQKWAGNFVISAEARSPHHPEEVEKAIYEELERLKNERVPPEELQKVKNNFAAAEYRRLTSNFSILVQLLVYDGLGDWREINASGAKYQQVSAEDLQRVACKYFTKEARVVGIFTRKADVASTSSSSTP